MYMNGGMGPRGPMRHAPNMNRSPMGGPGMNRGMDGRGPMPFGPNGIWRRYPMHYGPMWYRRPMGVFGGLLNGRIKE